MSSKRKGFFILLFILIIPIHVPAVQTTEIGSISEEGAAEIQSGFDTSGIPSVQAAIVFNNSLVWAKGYGEQSSLDTVYRTGSVTKTFTAAAFVKLQEEGLIDLDDDVSDYLPFQVRNPKQPDIVITIRMIIEHKAGFRSLYQFDQPWYDPAIRQWLLDNGLQSSLPEVTSFNGTRRPLRDIINSTNINDLDAWSSTTGTYVYSDTGYFFLSFLLEHITDDTWSNYIHDSILSPLGMDDTEFNITNTSNPIAFPYLESPENGTLIKIPIYKEFGYGAGAMITTAPDLAKFLVMVLNGGEYNGVEIFQSHSIPLLKQYLQPYGNMVGYSAIAELLNAENCNIGIVLLANWPHGPPASMWSAMVTEATCEDTTTTTSTDLGGPGNDDITL
ncbi:MAG: serine hydrolase domain-containing protein, partial [Candidatus Thorarchaeota archaeon]